MDQKLFDEACDKIIYKERERKQIGVLQEKTIHAVLKNYFEPNPLYHEIRIDGFYADIAREDEIIEIQTRNFYAIRKKLEIFLERSFVTVVYPIPATKWLCWINEETGEVSARRKSPKKGSFYQAFYELYNIKQFLLHPNLRIHLVLMDMEESRLLNGWSKDKKKGSERFDRIPLALVDELILDHPDDYAKLIPEELKEGFTSSDYAKAAKLSRAQAQKGLNILTHLGVVERIGKAGNAILYKKRLTHNDNQAYV